jgi:hypothetical protein
MPKVTFSMPTVVAIKIRGEGGKFPVMPNDGGLVGRFLGWSLKEEVFSVIPGGFSGGGGHLGFYSAQDAEKIKKWLEENGATEDDETTWSRGG